MKMKKNLMMMLAACLALSVPLSGCGSTVKDTSSSVSSEVSGEAETSGKSSQELLDEEMRSWRKTMICGKGVCIYEQMSQRTCWVRTTAMC